MSVKLEMKSSSSIMNRLGINKGGKAHLFFTNSCARHNDKYVPMDTGQLKNTVEIDTTKYTYVQPYAHKQYTTNKGKGLRGSYWDRRMWSAEKASIIKEVEDYIKR